MKGVLVEDYKENIEVNDFLQQTQEETKSSSFPKSRYEQTKDIVAVVGDVAKISSVIEMGAIAIVDLQGRYFAIVIGATKESGLMIMELQGDDVTIDIITKMMAIGMINSHNGLWVEFFTGEAKCKTKENKLDHSK